MRLMNIPAMLIAQGILSLKENFGAWSKRLKLYEPIQNQLSNQQKVTRTRKEKNVLDGKLWEIR